jgi:hypothetical protein
MLQRYCLLGSGIFSLDTTPVSDFLSFESESLKTLVGRIKTARLGSTMKGSTTINVIEVEATFLS